MTEPSYIPISASLERRPHPVDPRKGMGTVRLHVGTYEFMRVETDWFNAADPDDLVIGAALEAGFWRAGVADQSGMLPAPPEAP